MPKLVTHCMPFKFLKHRFKSSHPFIFITEETKGFALSVISGIRMRATKICWNHLP